MLGGFLRSLFQRVRVARGTSTFITIVPHRAPRNGRVHLSKYESQCEIAGTRVPSRNISAGHLLCTGARPKLSELATSLRPSGCLAACRRFSRGASLARRLAACAAGALGGRLLRGPLGSLFLRDLSHVSSLSFQVVFLPNSNRQLLEREKVWASR